MKYLEKLEQLKMKRDLSKVKVAQKCKFVAAARLEQKKHFSTDFRLGTEGTEEKFMDDAMNLHKRAQNAVRRARAARAAARTAEAANAASTPPWRR